MKTKSDKKKIGGEEIIFEIEEQKLTLNGVDAAARGYLTQLARRREEMNNTFQVTTWNASTPQEHSH